MLKITFPRLYVVNSALFVAFILSRYSQLCTSFCYEASPASTIFSLRLTFHFVVQQPTKCKKTSDSFSPSLLRIPRIALANGLRSEINLRAFKSISYRRFVRPIYRLLYSLLAPIIPFRGSIKITIPRINRNSI